MSRKELVEGFLQSQILTVLKELLPGSTDEVLVRAPNLFEAGLDSIGLVTLMTRVETVLGVSFDEETLSRFATLTVSKLGTVLSPDLSEACTRSISVPFMRRISTFGATWSGRPPDPRKTGLVIGSSNLEQGFSCEAFDAELRAHGLDLSTFNLAFAGLTRSGLTELLRFVRGRQGQEKFAFIFIELDPAAGDLRQSFARLEDPSPCLLGQVRLPLPPVVGSPLAQLMQYGASWSFENRGCRPFSLSSEIDRAEADLICARSAGLRARRAKEIAELYLGICPISAQEVAALITLCKLAQEMATIVGVFLSPLAPGLTAGTPEQRQSNDSLAGAERFVLQETGIRPVRVDGGLSDDMYADRANHLAPHREGPAIWSRALAQGYAPALRKGPG